MRRMPLAGALVVWIVIALAALAGDGNPLAYLDENDPFHPSRTFPKLVTPQWVGEQGVEAVVILSIDDMRGHEKWEEFLRPVLERLKKIDGRAALSIMTCQIDPRHPHLQKWLAEGVSLETHTFDHPCPLLQKGKFDAARSTYERCVDQMQAVPGSRAVAFRMPCCDSINSPSPRFYAEIFNRASPAGNFLEIDSSVFNIITANDPELPRELVLDAQGREIFRRYLPFKSYVVTVEDYPYPYVIGRSCWEFPCVVPSDWSAQHVQQPDNPRTVEDWKRALDAAVIKQGVFTLVFHPHGWIESRQLIELVDHAAAKHGRKVKFLNFREAAERLNEHLLAGHPLRATDGTDNGVRLLDLNHDGFQDVVIGNGAAHKTRLWSPDERRWQDLAFPAVRLAGSNASSPADDASFGVVHADGLPTVFVGGDAAWHFDGREWAAEPRLALREASFAEGNRALLRDLDGDGLCELLTGSAAGSSVSRVAAGTWQKLPFVLPADVPLVDVRGDDAGLRLADIDQDGRLDVLYSNDQGYAAYRFVSLEQGWAQKLVAGKPGDPSAIPMIARGGTNNGAWIHDRTLYVQNEDTDQLPDLVDRMPLDDLLTSVPYPGPKSPAQSLAAMYARPGFRVELMAAEPLVVDPIAIAFGPDGKLWVAEMRDYPQGVDANGEKDGQGGCVRFLEDTDGDARYDKSTLFLEGLGYPNGVAPWRSGVIISCAPDILYAEDTDGDGRADKRQVLYTNFAEGNPQHRMNGFTWGMDGWLYGAHGDAQGGVKLIERGEQVDANNRDFRIRPDEGFLDPQAGISQFVRSVDDWGNWFGNSNSNPLYQYVLADHYLRRNEHVPAEGGQFNVSEQPGAAEVFPRSRTLARFNDLYAANRFTSANSAILYRDELFGPAFEGNSFVSEPVHNLVHREVLRREGLTFRSRRADDEREREFLASADNWFRPTSLVTGPDGALWIADMYRQTIEHPEWIPVGVQEQLDLRAGSDMGRIYRVAPVGVAPRPIPRLDNRSTGELVAALDSPSGWQRDMAQQLLLWRADMSAIEPLGRLAAESKRPQCRAQALWTLELLGGMQAEDIVRALKDAHPGVRRQAIEIAEAHLPAAPQLGEAILASSADDDPHVQLQRAYTLGAWQDPRAGTALGELALCHADDAFMTAAVLSSVHRENLYEVTTRVLAVEPPAEPPAALVAQLVALAGTYADERTLAAALARIGRPHDGRYAAWQMTALVGLLDVLDGADASWEKYDPQRQLSAMFARARERVADESAVDDDRLRALRLLGRDESHRGDDIQALVALLVPQSSGQVQTGAVEALVRMGTEEVPQALVAGWRGHGPELRSQVLEALLNRPEWNRVLLAAVESGQVPAADIDAARRQRLQSSDDDEIKAQATRLLAGDIESNRAQVLAAHQGVLEMTGDAQAGAAVFAKRCAVCHRLRGAGTDVGPDLASLTDYSPQALLVALLDPNKAVEAKYLDYLAVTTSGLSYTGLLAGETGNSVTLKGQEGKQQTILRSELEALQATGKSLMPEGLEKDLSPADLANVISYLRGSGAPRKQFRANRPRLVTPTTDGTLQLYPTTCEVYGPTVEMEWLYKNLSQWQSENDRVVWNVELPKPGRYTAHLNYACPDQHAGNAFVLETGDQKLTGTIAGTGTRDSYREVSIGELNLPAGAQQIILRSAGPIRGELMHFGGVLLKPAGR